MENKRKLAEAIDDNQMLIVALRFYLAHLRANRRIAAAPIRAIEREKSRRIRQHLRAVRRVLCIGYRKATTRTRRESRFLERDVMTMPGSYRVKLEAIGFAPWSDPDELAAFESVNANLQLDEDTAAFARRYPILENVKRFLLAQQSGKPNGAVTHSPPIVQNKIILDVQNKQAHKKAANFTW